MYNTKFILASLFVGLGAMTGASCGKTSEKKNEDPSRYDKKASEESTEEAVLESKPSAIVEPGGITPSPPAPAALPAAVPELTVTSKIQGTWASDQCNHRYPSAIPFSRPSAGDAKYDLIVAMRAYPRYKITFSGEKFELQLRMFHISVDDCLANLENKVALELNYSGTYTVGESRQIISPSSGGDASTHNINNLDYNVNRVTMRANTVWKDSTNLVCGVNVKNKSIAEIYDVTESVCNPKYLFDIISAWGHDRLALGDRIDNHLRGQVRHGWTQDFRPVDLDLFNSLKKVL